MKLSHIVKYHNDFLEVDNDLYRTMLSGLIALCSCEQKFTMFDGVRSLSPVILITSL